jgi:hypothetical protein
MSKKQAVNLSAQTHGRMDGRLIAVAVLLAVLVAGAALVHLVGPIGPPTFDPQANLVGP